MKTKKLNTSSGAISNTLLILGVALLIVIVIVFVVLRTNAIRNANKTKEANLTENNEPPPPVYETVLGDVRFVFVSAQDIGNFLPSKDLRLQPNLTTTEKFITVVIGAQNKGKLNVPKDSWNIGNIIDSEGRNFIPVNQNNQGYYFLNRGDLCSTLLKPEFEPTPCIKHYEVSKESKGLKIEVYTNKEGTSKRQQTALLDLLIQ